MTSPPNGGTVGSPSQRCWVAGVKPSSSGAQTMSPVPHMPCLTTSSNPIAAHHVSLSASACLCLLAPPAPANMGWVCSCHKVCLKLQGHSVLYTQDNWSCLFLQGSALTAGERDALSTSHGSKFIEPTLHFIRSPGRCTKHERTTVAKGQRPDQAAMQKCGGATDCTAGPDSLTPCAGVGQKQQ
jgi:hypothetical protein